MIFRTTVLKKMKIFPHTLKNGVKLWQIISNILNSKMKEGYKRIVDLALRSMDVFVDKVAGLI